MRIIKVPYLNKNQTIHDISINCNGEYMAVAEKYVYIYRLSNISNDIKKTGLFSRDDLMNERRKQIEIKENGFIGNKNKEIKDSKEVKITNNANLCEEVEIEKENEEIDPEEEKQNEIILKQLKDNQLKDLMENVYILINDNISNMHAVTFLNNSSEILLTGGMDKSLLIYNLDYENKKYKALRALNLSSEIAVIKTNKNDDFVLASCFDFNIYVIQLKYDSLNSQLICFEAKFKIDNNTGIVQSIAFDPLGSNKFVTFSEDKKIYLYEIDFNNYNNFHQENRKIPISIKILKTIEEYHSDKFNYPPMKKISWGINDMIVIPNFLKIKEYGIPHCKIFKFFDVSHNMMNMNINSMIIEDPSSFSYLKTSNLLVGGHESPILNAVSYLLFTSLYQNINILIFILTSIKCKRKTIINQQLKSKMKKVHIKTILVEVYY